MLSSCEPEKWTLKELTSALTNMHIGNKEIIVPMFQRGKRWKIKQEEAFIDSLEKNYPIGTMLFFRTVEGRNKEIYTLVDGLQRANTIKKYMLEPSKYFTITKIPIEIIDNIYNILGLNGEINKIKLEISEIIVNTIQNMKSIYDYHNIALNIVKNFATENKNALELILENISPFIKDYQAEYDRISNITIPVVVYTGEENNLPEIFDRINSEGIALTTYEVYAASWPMKRFKVSNSNIVEKVLKKYDILADDGYNVEGYDRENLRINKELTSFEYIFGLSKFLNDQFDFLHLEKKPADDEINTLGFELINACINDSNDKIKNLYEHILKLDINLFEDKLIEAIKFVENIIKPITKFKGNSRSEKKILHTKYQILSLISTTFREKYDISDLNNAKRTWQNNKILLEKNMIQHYIFDIVSNEWGEGGTNKIHRVARPNKYLQPIPIINWETTLNAYFQKSNTRLEKAKIPGPKQEDIVILNCIYLPLFSALDQLSLENFDTEHIATKEQMKVLISNCNGEGLPISSIANLCYLPEKANRSKKDKTFYQDINYLSHINLAEVENKYSFTKEADLGWLDTFSYQNRDFEGLKAYYFEYLLKRFKIQKQMLYKSLGIDYSELEKLQLATETV